MIAEEIFHFHALGDGVFSHGDAAGSREIIFRDLASLFLVVSVYKINRLGVHNAFHLLSIAIVNELRYGRVVLFHLHETVLSVVGQFKIIVADVTRGLVAVVVIDKSIHACARRGMRTDSVCGITQRNTCLVREVASGGIVGIVFRCPVQCPAGLSLWGRPYIGGRLYTLISWVSEGFIKLFYRH